MLKEKSKKTASAFEELKVYQQTKDLVNEVYKATRKASFAKDFSLVDQVRRSAVSVLSNIAEGFERGTRPDFVRFLFIAKGSCGELRAQLEVAKDQGYLPEVEHGQIRDRCKNVSGMIANLIKYLKTSKA